MTPAWAQRREELLRDCIVSPDVFTSMVERLGDFVVPYQHALETETGQRNLHLYLQGLLSHLPGKNAEDIATFVDVERQIIQDFIGSGAFSITLCRRYPALRATLIDFPKVIDTAQQFVAASGVAQQIACIPGDALTVQWPQHQDVILMSYLLSAVSQRAIRHLIEQAYGSLRPGGMLLLHDFMVEEDRTGPTTAALWFTVFLSNPEAISFTPGGLVELLSEQGFAVEEVREVIPSITKLLVAKKPGGETCCIGSNSQS